MSRKPSRPTFGKPESGASSSFDTARPAIPTSVEPSSSPPLAADKPSSVSPEARAFTGKHPQSVSDKEIVQDARMVNGPVAAASKGNGAAVSAPAQKKEAPPEHVISADARMREADLRMEKADRRVEAVEARLAALHRSLATAEADRDAMERDVERAHEDLEKQSARASELESDRASFERRMHEQATAARNYLMRLRDREAALENLYASASWRLTAPMRSFKMAMTGAIFPASQQAGSMLAPPPEPQAARSAKQRLQPARKIFLECTHTLHSDLNTGIQRVVRNIVRHADKHARAYGYEVVPVVIDGDRFVYADREQILRDKQRAVSKTSDHPEGLGAVWRKILRGLAQLFPFKSAYAALDRPSGRPGFTWLALLPFRLVFGLLGGVVSIIVPPRPKESNSQRIELDDYRSHKGHILVLLDSSWTVPIWQASRDFRAMGGKTIGVIYDLIPVTHPHTSVEHLTRMFAEWLRNHFGSTDGYVAISNTVAGQLTDYARKDGANRVSSGDAKVSYFHLGSELDFLNPTHEPRGLFKALFAREAHIFLMVGTIEPRKNHEFVLDAFEKHWADGGQGILLICGRQSWKTEALLERMAEHEMLGDRLIVVRDATDEEIDFCYKNASALIIASEIEGFGLPIVEAFQRGLPVICSDIPVFREIAEGRAEFFGLGAPSRLTTVVNAYIKTHNVAARAERKPGKWLSWDESAKQLVDAVFRVLGGKS